MSDLIHQFAEKVVRSPFLSGLAGVEYRTVELDITPANLNAGDEWHFIKLPADAIVIDIFLGIDELDAATAMTLHVGHDGDDDAFLVSDTTARAGGFVAATDGLPLLPDDAPSDIEQAVKEGDGPFYGEEGRTIMATVAIAPTTAQEGKAVLTVGYFRTRQR